MNRAIVLFSGGIDSTTSLYWAKREFSSIIALTFDYAQKHRIEVEMSQKIAANISSQFYLFRFSLKDFIHSALIDNQLPIPDSLAGSKNHLGIPITYVPFRNGIFLSLAAAFAESQGIQNIAAGFNCIDSPDYPDTTWNFTRKMQAAINEGTSALKTGKKIKIHTPLIRLTKKEIIELGIGLHADYSFSISCYRGGEIPCQRCPSCEIRGRAFQELRMRDPLIERLQKEGKV